MTIVSVIMAMTGEIAAFEHRLENSGFYRQGNMEYRRNNLSVHILQCGVGARRLKKMAGRQELLQRSTAIVIAGISGAVDGGYGIGDTIIPRRVCMLDTQHSLSMDERLAQLLEESCARFGIVLKPCHQLATAEHLVDKQTKQDIGFADAVDMETYRITAWLTEYELPRPVCIRVISDTRSQRLPEEKSVIEYMRDPRHFILKNVWQHPLECCNVLKLMWGSKKAVNMLGNNLARLIECFDKHSVKGQHNG